MKELKEVNHVNEKGARNHTTLPSAFGSPATVTMSSTFSATGALLIA